MRISSILAFGALAIQVACVSSSGSSGGNSNPAYLEMSTKDGVVTGFAGSAWTEKELRTIGISDACGASGTVTDVVIERQADGSSKFSGRCA